MNTTDTIPFLVVHGGWLWKAALAGFVLLALVTAWAIRRVIRRYTWRAELARLREAGGRAEAAERETIAGVLRGGAGGEGKDALARSLRAEAMEVRRPDGRLDWRAGEVHLETADGRRIELAGELRVLAGSRAARARGGVPRQLSDADLEEARRAAPWLHRQHLLRWGNVFSATLMSLHAGDEIVARGKLERGPSSEESGFRSAEVTWTMRGGDEPIELMARRPAVPRTRASLLLVAGFLAATTFGGYQLEKQLGESWNDECWSLELQLDRGRSEAPLPLSPLVVDHSHACVKAAAAPGHRDRALDKLLNILEGHRYRDEATLRRLNQLTNLAQGCDKVVARLMSYARHDEAMREARRCGDPRSEYEALVAQGRHEEAARIHLPKEGAYRPALPELQTLIAAGQWAEAAAALDVKADAIRTATYEKDVNRDSVDLTAMHFQCLATLLRHHGGDPQAEAQLRALRAGRHGISCAPMLAELEGPDARNTAAPAQAEVKLWDTSRMLQAQAFTAGLESEESVLPSLDTPEEVLVAPSFLSASALWWPWIHAAEPAKTLVAHRPHLLRWRAVHQVFIGELAGARQSAQEAMELARGPDATLPYELIDLRHLLPAITLYTPSTSTGVDFTVADDRLSSALGELWLQRYGHLLLRDGKPIADAQFGSDKELIAALTSAQGGDGHALARYVAGDRYDFHRWSDNNLIAVLPRIITGREELAHWLRWSSPRDYLPDTIAGAAVRAFLRREVMKFAGLPDQAASWDATFRRLDGVLSDRKRLAALWFLDL